MIKKERPVVGSILIADDDNTYRDSIQKVFEREGYLVESACDVDGALAAMHIRHFDLVVCDYRMPGKTGLDFLEQLKREHSVVPVLMISACTDSVTHARALELGAIDLIRKPVRRQELIDRAARVMGG
jgi:DNA-binding response OmpR family regulator